MKSVDLERHTDEIVASISYAWTLLKPELLQTFHTLARQSLPATAGMAAPPVDTPVTNTDSGISLRPSEMQRYFVSAVIPTILAGLQSIAEDTLNDHFGDAPKMAVRQRTLRANGTIDANLASEAHFWRLVRNVSTRGNGTISQVTEVEARRLLANGDINFTEFALWGPLLDAGHGGVSIPLARDAQTAPYAPGATARRTPIVAGQQIEIGLGDVLACGRTWAQKTPTN